MFTGIVEATGLIKEMTRQGTNASFWIESPISQELKVDQSVSHSGVCLTVEAVNGNQHKVTAIEETLKKTNLNSWKKGTVVNLERCLKMDGRLDGHIVQGHVDATAICIDKQTKEGSWEYLFQFPEQFAAWVIEKGSVCINGISLTAFDAGVNTFKVAIIPYTYNHTNMNQVEKGSVVNIEFDVIGKYITRMQQVQQQL